MSKFVSTPLREKMKIHTLQPLKKLCVLLLAFATTSGFTQSLPINFEGTNISLIDYDDGGQGSIVDNPKRDGSNLSYKCAKIVRGTGNILEDNDAWAGSKLVLSRALNFGNMNSISMKVYTEAPVGTKATLKLENGSGPFEQVDVFTRASGAWQTLIWDFTGTSAIYNELVFMFDRDNVGDESATSTFYFDDIRHIKKKPRKPIDLPITFDVPGTDYSTTDFGDNQSSMVRDPEDSNNNVIKVVKLQGAASWAGTTIGTDDGLASNIPITTSNSIMTVRVWAPRPGVPIMLKVENSSNPTQSVETLSNTSVRGWQTMTFNFSNERPGTQALNVALNNGAIFNMPSLFFNYGRDGSGETFYFDDVVFVE